MGLERFLINEGEIVKGFEKCVSGHVQEMFPLHLSVNTVNIGKKSADIYHHI